MKSSIRRCVGLVLALLVGIASTAGAQDLPLAIDTPVPGVSSYDDAIPTPQAVIGHEIGTRHTRPDQVVAYFEAVAAASDRVTLASHGRTHGHRRLIHAFVTSPGNHSRLEDIRQANVQLVEAPASVSDADLESMPAVAYMGYSIHGDEASGTEAAMLFLYHMAAGQGGDIQAALDNTVLIVDPMMNPDGRDRFVDWANGNRGATATADPQDREHNQNWPGGRTNHYWFDLNRDWLLVQHPASQGRIDLFHQWKPQVLTDFHEMGSEATYFFQPGIPSRTNPNTPQRNQDLTAEIATYHAELLDDIGSLYYTRESFDDFYYGKGSTYPDINGTIGILFEQASSRALKTETSRGVMNYAFTVRNQFTTSLSTLEALTQMRTDLLRHQRTFYSNVDEVLDDEPVQAYIVDMNEHRTRAQALAQVLQRHQVELYDLAETVETDGRTYQPGQAYVVPLDQQQGRFVKSVMERTSSYPDSLFYDVSTWTLPLSFGVKYSAYERGASNLLGDMMDAAAYDGGQLVGGRSNYAYIMEWDHYFAPRALYRLQNSGIHARLMRDGFSARVGGQARSFRPGSIVIQVQQFDVPADTVHAAVQRAVERDHVSIYATATGLTPNGPDLGSRGAPILEQPSVALLVGAGGSGSYFGGTSAYNAGEAWHLLSDRFEMDISLLNITDMSRADLSRYNTIVMAGGGYGDVPTDAVRQWVRQGGRLIALDSAVEWVVSNEMVALDEKPFDVDSLVQDQPYDQLSDAYGAQGIGGSIFQVDLDNTHPLAYGYDESVAVFRDGTTFFTPSDDPGASVGVYAEDEPRLSGYISDDATEVLKGSAAIEGHGVGRGNVVLLHFNPNFRAFWYGTNGLFLNALFFGDAF